MNNALLSDWKAKLTAATDSNLLAAETVSESDVDIVMGIMISSDPEFRAWLVSVLTKDCIREHDHVHARWGVWTQSGESDLVWFFATGKKKNAILFENKINAGPQPKQYDRYCERVGAWKKAGLIDESFIVLVSPSAYQSSEANSYIRLSYEVILQWLRGAAITGLRKELERLLLLGINKPQQGWSWTIRTDDEILDWYQWLWTLREKHYPNLWIIGKCPSGKNGKVSAWHTVPFSRGAHKYWMNLKLGERDTGGGWGSTKTYSAVDLEIKGAAERIDALRPDLQAMMTNAEFKIVKADKSVAVRRDVPLVRKNDYSESTALQMLAAVQEIQDWFEKNEIKIDKLLSGI